MSFANKVAIVTGSSSGIGAATAIHFTKEGANVVVVGRNEAKLKKVTEKCTKAGKAPLVIKADVSKDEDAKRIIKETVDKFGKLDILVNNAGIMRTGNILDGTTLKIYDEMVSTNLRAVIHLTSLAAPHIVKTKGNIINISSVAGLSLLQDPGYAAYCTTKAGLDHFTRGAALELAAHGVRVNSVNPGPVRTDILETKGITEDDAFWDSMKKQVPLNRISEPEEIANLILFLASDKAKSITGSLYVADNGILLKA